MNVRKQIKNKEGGIPKTMLQQLEIRVHEKETKRRRCINAPMDEVVGLQVGHAGGDLHGHVEENRRSEFAGRALAEVIEEISMGHILRDNIVGRLPGTNTYG